MKRQYGKIMQRLAALTLGVFLIASPMAQAAVNTAIGDVNDVGADLADSNLFTLTRSTPTLIKAAFLTSDNTPLTSGDVLPAGTSVDFLIYLNNVAGIDILEVFHEVATWRIWKEADSEVRLRVCVERQRPQQLRVVLGLGRQQLA